MWSASAFSAAPPLTARPTQDVCDVALAFHIDRGSYDGTPLDDLNVVVAGHVPGAMADGGWMSTAVQNQASVAE
jgi:hypothetical protein